MNSLSRLSNQELEARLKDLVNKERKLLHVILEHIKEVDARKLYLERAYSSIYEYLVKELNYSGSAAMRRLEAARLLKAVPAVAERIQEGSLNLSQIGELSRAIKEKEKSGIKILAEQKSLLVDAIVGKTTKETQRELCVALDIALKVPEAHRVQKDESVHLSVTLTKSQHELLLRCKDLASHSLQQKHKDFSWASVFEELADQYFSNKSGRSSNAITNANARSFSYGNTDAVARASSNTDAATGRINKTLTPKTRRSVLLRDQCCQYRDPVTGRKCGATFSLQVDHKTSQWAGGDHSPQGLQAFCQGHNKHKYRKEAGIRFL